MNVIVLAPTCPLSASAAGGDAAGAQQAAAVVTARPKAATSDLRRGPTAERDSHRGGAVEGEGHGRADGSRLGARDLRRSRRLFATPVREPDARDERWGGLARPGPGWLPGEVAALIASAALVAVP